MSKKILLRITVANAVMVGFNGGMAYLNWRTGHHLLMQLTAVAAVASFGFAVWFYKQMRKAR